MDVWVTGRTAARIEAVAAEIGGHALTGDVSLEDDVAHWFEQTSLGRPARQQRGSARPDGDLRPRGTGVVVAGIRDQRPRRVPVLPRRRSKDARTRGGRIVNVTSGAAYLPAGRFPSTAYAPSKAAVHRFSELLAAQLAPRGVFVFAISPGLVRTAIPSPTGTTMLPGRPRHARHGSCMRWRPASSTRSPGATSTPSTIRRRSCVDESRRSEPAT